MTDQRSHGSDSIPRLVAKACVVSIAAARANDKQENQMTDSQPDYYVNQITLSERFATFEEASRELKRVKSVLARHDADVEDSFDTRSRGQWVDRGPLVTHEAG